MSIRPEEIQSISSEKEFEDYVKRTFRDEFLQRWIIGTGRGEKILELLKRSNQNVIDSLILDLGCGCGGISLFLSGKIKRIVGIDIDKESIGVAHLRAKVSNRNNFVTMVGSATNVPIKNDSIDFVLINGALEWIPYCKPNQNPESTQLDALEEVRRMLKRRGTLILAIENRFYLRYWLGIIDHHSGLRFVPILPRKIADFVCKRKKGELYLNRTYSYFGLKDILRKAGFNAVKVHVGIPDYLFSEEIVEINNRDEMRRKIYSVRQRKSRKIVWETINKTRLMKFLCSNFIVVCQK